METDVSYFLFEYPWVTKCDHVLGFCNPHASAGKCAPLVGKLTGAVGLLNQLSSPEPVINWCSN